MSPTSLSRSHYHATHSQQCHHLTPPPPLHPRRRAAGNERMVRQQMATLRDTMDRVHNLVGTQGFEQLAA